jgi:cytosine/adenosine deaminase-related metal-dependent hydrolase
MFGVRAGGAFDGERVVPGGALVLFDGGRIVGVEPGAAPAPDGCEVLEAPGGTVLPGLIDAHVHLCADGTDGSLDRIEEPGEDARLRWIGHRLRAECEVIVDPGASAVQAHQVAVDAEHNLLHALPRLAAALVHAGPQAQARDDHHAVLAPHR